MRGVFVLLTLASIGNGIQHGGFKVKFGWSNALADMKYFFSLPLRSRAAEGEGWRRTERPKGPLEELRMYCPPGRMVCTLYDTAGFVAGLQIAVPVDSIDPELKPERYLEKWSPPTAEGEPPRDFWTATQYYVSEESLKAGAGPTAENGATLQDGGVWVKGLDGKLMRIPVTEDELKTTLFKKQNCIPNMGSHYYYNMTKELQCDHFFLPWFALVTKGELLGVGFQTFGKKPMISKKQRQWFEDVPTDRKAPLMTVPYAPECLLDLNEKYGGLSIHVYYIGKPWELRCEAGDSIEPAPVMDRMMFNVGRYMNAIGDQIEKIISG